MPTIPSLIAAVEQGDQSAAEPLFAALYTDSSAARCDAIAEEVRAAVGRHPGLDGFRFTAAIGSASWPPAASLAAAIEEADARVYADKRRSSGSRSDAA